MTTDHATSGVTRADDARSFSLTPTQVTTFLCEGSEQMPDVMWATVGPGEGPPLHSHSWASWDVVVRGSVLMRIEDETYELGPGDFTYTPPEVVHTFMGVGDTEAVVVGYSWPGGFQHMYAEMERIFQAPDGPDFEALAALSQQHGVTLHGPPLAVLGHSDR